MFLFMFCNISEQDHCVVIKNILTFMIIYFYLITRVCSALYNTVKTALSDWYIFWVLNMCQQIRSIIHLLQKNSSRIQTTFTKNLTCNFVPKLDLVSMLNQHFNKINLFSNIWHCQNCWTVLFILDFVFSSGETIRSNYKLPSFYH